MQAKNKRIIKPLSDYVHLLPPRGEVYTKSIKAFPSVYDTLGHIQKRVPETPAVG